MGAARELVEEALELYNLGDHDQLVAIYAEDALDVIPEGATWGRASIARRLRRLQVAFPDQHVKPVIWIEDGNRVVVEYSWTATHTGALVLPQDTYLPATGEQLAIGAVSLFQLRNGSIAAHRAYLDQLPPAIRTRRASLSALPGATH